MDPNTAPFSDIGRATDFAATMLMQRFDVRETSLPCLLFLTSSRMQDPQVVQLSPSEPMESLYRDVLAPLSDELRLVDGLRRRRGEISSRIWQYDNAKRIVAEFPDDQGKFEQELEKLRTKIERVLSASSEPLLECANLEAERANLEAIRREYKGAKTLEERIALGLQGPYAARVIEMTERLDRLMSERIMFEAAPPGDSRDKRLHELSSSVGRLRNKLGALATKPANDAANRLSRLEVDLRRLKENDPVRPLRERESDLTRRLGYLRSNYEGALKTIAEHSGAALDDERKKVAETEEQLRRHGFADHIVQADRMSALDVVEVLIRTGVIGHTKAGRGSSVRRPSPLFAAPRKMLLLFMHGLGGARKSTWGNFPSFLMSDQSIADRFIVDYYSFPTQIFRLPFSPRAPKIQVLADGLRTQIRYAGFERVSLACHSLGGLVAKQYLIEEIEANRDLQIDRVAFFGVPNNGSDLAAIGSLVSWRQHQLRQLQKDSDIIEFSNKAWRRLDIRNKVRLKYIVGSQDRVVDRLSALEYWGNPDVETVVGSGHIDLVKPKSPDELVVRIMREFLLS